MDDDIGNEIAVPLTFGFGKSLLDTDPDAHLHSIDRDRFRLLAENIPTLCWMADANGYIFWYNQRWHQYCGSSANDMEGWGWQSAHDPDVLPEVLKRWTASIESSEPFEMTFPLRGSDGIFRPFLTRIHPATDDDGTVIWWFGVSTEITAQVEAEQRLEAAHQALHQIAAQREAMLSQLTEGVIITDTLGKIIFVNDMATKLHGVTRLDIEPESYVETYSLYTPSGDPHPTETLPLVRAVQNLETVIDAHWRIKRPDGTELLVIGNAQPFYDKDGGPIGAVLTIRDDTQRHATEQALADAGKMKDILLHEVNHRVKNSLQLVTSLLMLQAGQEESEELKRKLLEARARIAVVASVHTRLYTSGQHDRVDLSSYLQELTTQTVRALNQGNRIQFQFESSGEIIIAIDQAVPTALLISELLTNALKYAFDKNQQGIIRLQLVLLNDEIQIMLTDNGRGLGKEFDITQRSGLGMRIVTALIGQIHGRIEIIDMQPGAGFCITLPGALL